MKKKEKIRPKKLYTAIAKVGYNKSLQQNICVKYRFNKVDNFLIFIQKKFPSICWINIFNNIGIDKDKLVYTWGKNKGLQRPY